MATQFQTRQLNALRFARKLLALGALLQIAFFATRGNERLYWTIAFISVACAVTGYVVAAKNVDAEPDPDDTGWSLFSFLKGMGHLTLVLPVFNLPMIAFGYFRAGQAIKSLR